MGHFRVLFVFVILIATFCRGYDICGGQFYTKTGVISSPNYPNKYPPNTICEWSIESPRGHQVELNVTGFELESVNCRYDYLEIRNGPNSTSPLIGKYCGTNIPATITSFGNRMYLKFRTDFTINYKGFNIRWNSTTIGCNSTLTHDNGFIYSPNYPMEYSSPSECYWTIRTSANSSILLTILDLSLESGYDCRWDYIEIYEGNDTTRNRLGRYCGKDHPPQIIRTTSNVATVRFRSDDSLSMRGFQIKYQTQDRAAWNTTTEMSSTTEMPSTTTERFSRTWHSTEYRYRPTTETASWEMFLEGETEAPQPEGTTREPVWYDVVFESTPPEGCNHTLTDDYGYIESPNYPEPYNHGSECYWKIRASTGSVISLEILDLSIENSNNCHWDFVEIYEGDDTSGNLLGRYCWNYPQHIQITSNVATVHFRSDSSISGRGFRINYQTHNRTTWGTTTEMPSTTTERTTREPDWNAIFGRSRSKVYGKITAAQRVVNANVNETAILSCNVRENLPSNFTWVHRWNLINSEDSKYSTSLSYHNETYATMTLRFVVITPEDAGFFSCLAQYPGRLISDDVFLEVNDSSRRYSSGNSSTDATSEPPILYHPGVRP